MVSNPWNPDGPSDVRVHIQHAFRQKNKTATSLLAANVRRLRLAKKMTQDDLAAAVEIEQREISLIENERANPAVLLLDSLAVALGVEMADLFAPTSNSSPIVGRRQKSGH